jgi:hypothetical protein
MKEFENIDWSALREPGIETWSRIAAIVLARPELEATAEQQLCAALASWPYELRAATGVGTNRVDPWWNLGRERGSTRLLSLVRQLTLDSHEWLHLPADSRWSTGGARGIRQLRLGWLTDGSEVEVIARGLPHVAWLDLRSTQIVPGWRGLDEDELTRVVSPFAARLRGLDLRKLALWEAGVRALICVPEIAKLEAIRFDYANLGVDGCLALAKWPDAGLRTMSIRGCGIDDRIVLAWAARSLLTGLRGLDLSGNDVGVDGLRAVFASAPHLELLRLGDMLLGPDVLELLGTQSHERSLELDLSYVPLDSWLLATLLDPAGPGLRALDLRGCDIDDDGVEVLRRTIERLAIRWIDLRGNSLTDEVLRSLMTTRPEVTFAA